MKQIIRSGNIIMPNHICRINELLLVDKPKGITSFDVIRVLRRKLRVKKMGHAGTLDPQATGLLIIGVGAGTKRLKELLDADKVYVMEVLLGKRTETGDLEGKVLEEAEVAELSLVKIQEILRELEGEIELPVPLYSAVKLKGVPFYKYARQGIAIETPLRKVKIHHLKLLAQQSQGKYSVLEIEMNCSKGTYARTVAEEIGKRLGVPATLQNLCRTKIGSYKLTQAKNLEEF